MISVDEHLAQVLDRIEPLPAFPQPLMDSLGTPVAEDVYAPIALPVFDNASMDGYAVSFRDVADATPDRPIHLPVVGEIAAGTAQIFAMSPGTALRIMTGAPVPQGCSAVVPVEWTDNGDVEVKISRAPEEGQHIRRAGEDVVKGDLLLRRGTPVGPRQLGLLASVGMGQVPTPPRPRVVVMSTGAELVEPGQELGRDSIYDANSYLLAAAVRASGAIAYRVPAASDDAADFADALSDQLVRADVVVTSGGVSKGTHDVVKEALGELGTVWFGEVAMQPGKPQGFGVVGEDATPIFTLPGNPVSAYISFELFVVPALRKMTGQVPLSRPMQSAALEQAVGSVRGRRQFLRGRYTVDSRGASVAPVGGAGSHLMGGLSGANCLIVVGEDAGPLEVGHRVPVLLLDGDY
ncbi:MAG: molybdopterin molybdotransferase MoeA [Actinomycetota bacterium]|nr:molybdopterin molybdotransferase MoeA [Actinomycetota bacterium]